MAFRKSVEKNDIDIKITDEEASHHENQARVVEIDTFRVCGLSDEDADFYTSYPEQDRKKVFHKVKRSP